MATSSFDLGNAFVEFSKNIQWRVVEKHSQIILHTEVCNKYSYFFDDEPSKPIQHPCMLGYKYWTNSMSTNYLMRAHSCKFQMPTIASDVTYFWEEGPEEMAYRLTSMNDEEEANIQTSPKYQAIKENIEQHWNFLRHLAKKVVGHNAECKHYKKSYGKFGCLENFTKWDGRIIREYYEPKTECDFLKKSYML
jgi:hypothetical protein